MRRLTLRHCERSEAIQSASADTLLDCFAALGMTMEKPIIGHPQAE
jgi:hypothetical protein